MSPTVYTDYLLARTFVIPTLEQAKYVFNDPVKSAFQGDLLQGRRLLQGVMTRFVLQGRLLLQKRKLRSVRPISFEWLAEEWLSYWLCGAG